MSKVLVGNDFKINFIVHGVRELHGVAGTIRISDTSKVQVKSSTSYPDLSPVVEKGGFLDNFGNIETALDMGYIEGDIGKIAFGYSRLGSRKGINGSGSLFSLYFNALVTGVAWIWITDGIFRIIQGDGLSPINEKGSFSQYRVKVV